MKKLLTAILLLQLLSCQAQNIDSIIQKRMDSISLANRKIAYFSKEFIVTKISANVDSVKLASTLIIDSLTKIIANQQATISTLVTDNTSSKARLVIIENRLAEMKPQTITVITQ